jgi:hypothetical protein
VGGGRRGGDTDVDQYSCSQSGVDVLWVVRSTRSGPPLSPDGAQAPPVLDCLLDGLVCRGADTT